MKRFFQIAALLACLCAPSMASAACSGGSGHTCFGIATGNWGTPGTWSATSGGASCACTPITGDDLVFDAGSNGKTFTMEAAYSLNSLVASGATTATWTQNAFTLTITGNTFTLLATMTYVPSGTTRALSFTSTGGTTVITSVGKTFGNVTFDGVGGTFRPVDTLTLRSDSTLTLNNGTFDLATNNTNTTAGFFSSANVNTRVINMGSGTFTLNGNCGSTLWDFSTTTGLTFNKNTSTIVMAPAPASACSFSTGAQSYNNVTFTTAGGLVVQFILGNAGWTIANLTVTAPIWLVFGGSGNTLTNSSFTGTSSSNMVQVISSSINGTAATLTLTNAPSVATWVSFMNIAFAGAGSGFTASNCINFGGNSGVSCNGPSGGGGGGRIIGGWLLHRDLVPGNDNTPMYLDSAA